MLNLCVLFGIHTMSMCNVPEAYKMVYHQLSVRVNRPTREPFGLVAYHQGPSRPRRDPNEKDIKMK